MSLTILTDKSGLFPLCIIVPFGIHVGLQCTWCTYEYITRHKMAWWVRVNVMVFSTRRNYRPVASHWQAWSHIVVSSTPRHKRNL